MFIRFHIIHECDRHTDGHTHTHTQTPHDGIGCAYASRGDDMLILQNFNYNNNNNKKYGLSNSESVQWNFFTFNTQRPCLPGGFGMCVNSLPSSIRNAPSLTTFCRELKTVLFRSSFDND